MPVSKETIPYYFLWEAYRKKNDLNAQQQLIQAYYHLVKNMANQLSMKVPPNVISKDDLIGMGSIGLIEAIKKFDYQKGYVFETYGLWRIKGAMLDGLRQMDWVPRGAREKAKKLNEANRELEQKFERPPTEEELSNYLDLPLEEVKQSLSVLSLSTLLSLNEPVHANEDDDNRLSRLELLKDDQWIPQDQHVQMDEFKQLLAACIDVMPEKERLVITLLYYENLTQVEIAEVLNLTKGRISQLHSQAMLRFRKFFEAKGYQLDSFF